MESLKKSLDAVSSGNAYASILDDAAREWATHALSAYRGKLLRRALAISAALTEFTAEMNRS